MAFWCIELRELDGGSPAYCWINEDYTIALFSTKKAAFDEIKLHNIRSNWKCSVVKAKIVR